MNLEDLYQKIKPGKIYVVYKNQDPILKSKDKMFQKAINGKTEKVSKKGNVFITKISICECGVKRESRRLRSPDCYLCRNKNGIIGALGKDETKKENEREEKTLIFERKSKEITDCKHRIPICLIKYQKQKFIPCYDCKDYSKINIEDMMQTADGFKKESMI